MNEERRRAEAQGYESPVMDTIEGTHHNYNSCLRLVLDNLGPRDRVLIGSHNLDSVQLAKQLIEERGIKDGRARFAQLKGFSDHLTGSLAHEGFAVFKYLPYGPTEKVMPYLVRRGQESRQVLREQKFQNECLKTEIKRRLGLLK